MDEKKLENKNIKSFKVEDKTYFVLEDILDNFKEIKVDVEKILIIDDTPCIQAKDVHSTSDFDNIINKTLNFNPKKK